METILQSNIDDESSFFFDEDLGDLPEKVKKERRTKKKKKNRYSGKKEFRKRNRNRRVRRYNENDELDKYDQANELLTPYIEEQEREKRRNRSARKIQSVIRGNQTRKRHPPRDGPMDGDLIARITNRNIQGRDLETIRGKLEDLEDENESIGDYDVERYRYGMMYDYPESRDAGNFLYREENRGHPIIRAKNKNREALLDIHRRGEEMSRRRKMELGKEETIRKYPSPEQIEEELIEEYTPEYLYEVKMPEDVKKKAKKEWEETIGVLYDGDDLPELVPLTEEEAKGKSKKEDEYIHSPEKVKELKEYYRKISDTQVKSKRPNIILDENDTLKDVYRDQLQYYETPTIMSCFKIKGQTDANPKLFNDRKYLNTMIRPCKDNKLLTEIYIKNFEKLPTIFMISRNVDIMDFLMYIRSKTTIVDPETRLEVHEYFPNCIINGIREGLENIDVYSRGGMTRGINKQNKSYYYIKPSNSLYMISLIFKKMSVEKEIFLEREDLSLTWDEWGYHGLYIPKSSINGIDALKLFLDNLEIYYEKEKENPSKNNDVNFNTYNIEKTKRFLILLFMGIINGVTHDESVTSEKIERINIIIDSKINEHYTKLVGHYSGLMDPSGYDEKENINKGRRIKERLSDDEIARSSNILEKYRWYTALINEYKEIYVYFINKLEVKFSNFYGRGKNTIKNIFE